MQAWGGVLSCCHWLAGVRGPSHLTAAGGGGGEELILIAAMPGCEETEKFA